MRIVVLDGDETGQELLKQALRVLHKSVVGLDVQFERYKVSLQNRRMERVQARLAFA